METIVQYDCSPYSCKWDDTKEDEDWGYYSKNSKIEAECHRCKQRCTSDPDCSGVDCGSSYCSWWRDGKCSLFDSTIRYNKDFYGETCRKRSLGRL